MSIKLNLLHIHRPSGEHQIANAVGVPTAQGGEGYVPGPQGPQGEPGVTPQLSIGTVTTLAPGSAATASITGTAENPRLNLGIPRGADGIAGDGQGVAVPGPQGPQGEPGTSPVLHIGTVTTLPAGSAATASLTGTNADPVLNLGIPAGDTGPRGATPVRGVDYDTAADRQAIVSAVLAALPEYHGEVV